MSYWLSCEGEATLKIRFVALLEKLFSFLGFSWLSSDLKLRGEERIAVLQVAYYFRRIEELEGKRKNIESSIEGFRFDERLKKLTDHSFKIIRHSLAKRFNTQERKFFSASDLWSKSDEVLQEYPVILNTTFSVITSVRTGYLFDDVIVDEASQVDLISGVLAMASAANIVIVGDPMQLPNVLPEQDRKRALLALDLYDVPDRARVDRHSLLSSVRAAFPDAPQTLLREHYRCHPKIIEFCNQKFYGGDLLIMTRDQNESGVLKAYVTVEGNHGRGAYNQRQIDEIVASVLPELSFIDSSDVGIVSPFRMQVQMLRATDSIKHLEIDTVHKYQGREKRAIIITTVSKDSNDFVENPNLLNVAISRAQDTVRLVVSKELSEGSGNIADFVRYIRYQNCEVVPGKVRSIFDLLYGEYTDARLALLKNRKRASEFDSETLAYGEIEIVLSEEDFRGYSVVLQFPLSMLVQNTEHLTSEESSYATHPWTKVDFLIYSKVDKSPILVVEVDGYAFHREGSRQSERDALKDSVLAKCDLPVLRLSTVGSGEQGVIRKKLKGVLSQTVKLERI